MVGSYFTSKGISLVIYSSASIKKRDILRRYHLHILFQKLNIFFSLGVILQIVGIIYYGHKQVSQSSSEALEQTWAAVTSFSSDSNIVIASFVIFFGGIAGTLLGYLFNIYLIIGNFVLV